MISLYDYLDNSHNGLTTMLLFVVTIIGMLAYILDNVYAMIMDLLSRNTTSSKLDRNS